ncbi:MAG: asparagine synthetase B family protein [Psychroserpens sp.]|nr:asparagine synthetase B family protein [Psychroserpens sp.]
MNNVRTQILPTSQSFAKIKAPHELNLKAITIFLATGFFLDSDTFFLDEVCLSPGHDHTLDNEGYLLNSKPWFEWYYEPRKISFEDALEEYESLLTSIIAEQMGTNKVLLPLSGGLDSRSQALILKKLGNEVHSYSYSFKNGYPEHKIAQKIASVCGFKFQKFEIPESYLWDCIDELALINGCFSEFTHPRQMAVLNDFRQMDGEFSLGHWGDVLFDRGAPDGTQDHDILPLLKKKMLKKDGVELAKTLWEIWELDGNFDDYLESRLAEIIAKINIDNSSAKIRAFKTTQWAHRWTSTNLAIFENAQPIHLPYFDDRMCKFICTIPEAYLADRKLQIAHLKSDPQLSAITWHDNKPFNLNNYQYNRVPFNLPYRVINKLSREINGLIGKPFIQRNFELQFLGKTNDENLKSYLYEESFYDLIPKAVIEKFHGNFKTKDYVRYSHSLSMILTLSLWHKHFYNN